MTSTPQGSRDLDAALEEHRTIRGAKEAWERRLNEVLAEWQASLPADAATTWTRACAYVRHSSARSLGGEAPDGQLRRVLALLESKHMFVPDDALFFDVESGTEISTRAAFQRLFEAALAGGFTVVGAFVNERLFRNVEQAQQTKRAFRLRGIELEYIGRVQGGDPRSPMLWQAEIMQDVQAELHARNTSFYVGTQIETLTRAGRPVGVQPEVFVEGERAPSFLGRRGSVLEWHVQQPLGRILQEGCRKYLDGMSLADVAEWSKATELGGVTPAGHVMDKRWWYQSLKNPKHAGYQMPTTYMGFKPGKESPARPRRNASSELVPCMLPALWPLEDYHAVLAMAKTRSKGNKWRRTYRSYLLSGIAYDARCGCRVWVEEGREDGMYRMGCGTIDVPGTHGKSFRADIAAAELDTLLSGLTFEDPALIEAIEEELQGLVQEERRTAEAFAPDPRIGQLKQALAALAGIDATEVRDDLTRRLSDLEALDAERRGAVARPVVDFRRAIAQLKEWPAVWAGADVAEKNKLLQAAGLRVLLAPDTESHGEPAHLVSVEAENESFSLALAAALPLRNRTLGTQQSCWQPYVRFAFPLSGVSDTLLDGLVRDDAIPVHRPECDRGISLTAFARRAGVSEHFVRRWLREGRIDGVFDADAPGAGRWNIPVSSLSQVAAAREADAAGITERRRDGDGSLSVKEFARRAHAAASSVVKWIEEGRITPCAHPSAASHRYRISADQLERVIWRPNVPVDPEVGADGRMSVAAFARSAHASPSTVHEWFETGIIRARRRRSGSHVRLRIAPSELKRLPARRRPVRRKR